MMKAFDRETLLALKPGDRLVTEPLMAQLDPNERVEMTIDKVSKDQNRFRLNVWVWGEILLGRIELVYGVRTTEVRWV